MGRRLTAAFAGSAFFVATGCYSLQPVMQQGIPIGQMVSVNINDAGRAGLSGRMGPNVTQVMGRLVQKDTAYVLAVSEVQAFRAGTQVWSGEHVTISNSFVTSVSERKFSRTKTALLVGAAVGLTTILLSQGLLGSSSGDDTKPPVDTLQTNRIPLFIKR